jgi:predicted RNA-binding Zn-ribbon protein involved in translation (DUF1610 family)
MPMSSEFCLKSGIYEGDDVCKARITVQESDQFGPCPGCGREINWVAVQPASIEAQPSST